MVATGAVVFGGTVVGTVGAVVAPVSVAVLDVVPSCVTGGPIGAAAPVLEVEEVEEVVDAVDC
jgi:hypothetical protein